MLTRRDLLKLSAMASAGIVVPGRLTRNFAITPRIQAAIPNVLQPDGIDKFVRPLVIPPAMPRTDVIPERGGKKTDYYEIAVRQFDQEILPPSHPQTTVWSYGSVNHTYSFNYPAYTIEAKWEQPVRVKWINDLVDKDGKFLSHLLPVDQTLHWANPPDGEEGRDQRSLRSEPYMGPVPIVTHVHGADTYQASDGYPEAWYLPNANDIPAGWAEVGTLYDTFKAIAEGNSDVVWEPGAAVFQYPNEQRATTLWYHDHTLGITRLNVYAGPAGFYLLRGGPSDEVLDQKGKPATLPGPGPALGDAPGTSYYEIPIVIQDRSFNDDGSLFYPDNRAFFEGLGPAQLQIPFIPEEACDGELSDVSPIWNPEFFGNTIVVNGRTWPYLEVEQRRYRFRFLNGCNSRFIILKINNGMPFWQIGSDGGFLPQPVMLNELLLGPAERADVIVDFNEVPAGTSITLLNLGPDDPFGGGVPGTDFDVADPATTGQVMEFRVVQTQGRDKTTPPAELVLPAIMPLGLPDNTRQVSLNEEESHTVRVVEDEDGNIVRACDDPEAEVFGPTAALLGTLEEPKTWGDEITENPQTDDIEVWEMHNFTEDAHPIHVHLVQFQIVEREVSGENSPRYNNGNIGATFGPELGETGWKDTVIAYPGEITRIKARFDREGLYVWHCHILEHEDNEMMRPYYVGDLANSPVK